MNGLELSKGFYEEYGKPMLEKNFPQVMPFIAVGFTGAGSEHFGFDDGISRDHDFEPGFCIFLPDEETVDRRTAFLLERAYAKLPKEFNGVKRLSLSPVGGNRSGVFRTDDFFISAIGSSDGFLTTDGWLHIPDYSLAQAVNGEIFFDEYGEVTSIRQRLLNMPEDVKLKRLAGNLLIMAQAGQYNYTRCLNHGEPEAAQFACNEFVSSAMKCVFLLRGKYMPFYKWSFRALRLLENSEKYSEMLSQLLLGSNSFEKADIIEKVSENIICELKEKELTQAICSDLEKHAYSVNDRIKDGKIRNMNIFEAV